MASVKPSIPKGTRDFTPEQVAKRNYIFNTIRSVFEKYGYQPIETPTMESLSTLTGKYGEEGDQLLFRILNSGDYYKDLVSTFWAEQYMDSFFKSISDQYENSKEIKLSHNDVMKFIGAYQNIKNLTAKDVTSEISEKGLRYDLTVPFARYVVMHQNEITFPFKRYQIQPVFRADRPQRGRYREFYQCDADVVGSNSLLNEVELIQIYDEVFTKLKLPVEIRINNRKILQGLADIIGMPDRLTDIAIAIDKIDKIGSDGVKTELLQKGFSETQITDLFKNFTVRNILNNSYKDVFKSSPNGLKGCEELSEIIIKLNFAGVESSKFVVDLSLARGLSYYTGTIIEVVAKHIQMGSIGGGGRYDDLTGVFGLTGVSGVGISFGADRIYDVLEELKLFPETIATSSKVLFVNFDEKSVNYILPLLQQIRTKGIAAELYPSDDKMKKQMSYANDKKIPFVILAGEDEIKESKLTLKNMVSGEQEKLTIEEIISKLK